MIYDRDTGKKELAHRVAWKLATGSYPVTPVLHACDTPRCIRRGKKHLFIGTQRDNMIDMAAKGKSCNQYRGATSEEAKEIRHRYRAGETQMKIAAAFGFDQTYISRVVTGRILRLKEL